MQLAFRDVERRMHRASDETLLGVLRSLGVELRGAGEASGELESRRAALEQRVVEPVVVAWDGRPVTVDVRGATQAEVETEDGELVTALLEDGTIRLPKLPIGYHRLRVSGSRSGEALVIAAPRRAPDVDEPTWGVFLPLYALRTERDWGTGDLSDLEALLNWTARHGGGIVATLPLLASFQHEEPFEPSPYSPASRLFWNALFCDAEASPELARCPEARELISSPGFRERIERLRAADLVDYREASELKRRALEPLSEIFWSQAGTDRREAFESFLRSRPEAADYARFRSHTESRRTPWPAWPALERDGGLPDGLDDAARYHLYVQWLAHEQLSGLAERATGSGGLYFDLPLGVHAAGYDVWRERDAFALGASAGAPPDAFFTGGQSWGFPPLHPERIREDGYRHLIAVLRHLLRHATVLRVDHVMWLHRLYFVPDGMQPTEGAYVRYPSEELYALITLEAHRHGAVVVGEDLGTVPQEVRRAMSAHGVHRSHVLQFEIPAEEDAEVAAPPARAFASANTHDMAPFAAYWTCADIDRRRALGWLTEQEAAAERTERERQRRTLVDLLRRTGRLSTDASGEDALEVLRGALGFLASSEARVVVVTLEDLWGELEPQNVPGTTDEHPNWRRRARYPLEALDTVPGLVDTLGEIHRQRGRDEDMTERRKAERRPPTKPAGSPSKLGSARRGTPAMETPAGGPVVYGHSLLTDDDLYLFNEGTHVRLYEKLGSHTGEVDGTAGTHFAVWAPVAESVSVVGEFNGWDASSHPLRPHGASGIWEGFIPDVGHGTLYKYHVVSKLDGYTADKIDPFGFFFEIPPKTASIVWDLDYEWGDGAWMEHRRDRNALDAPQSTYELHIGSWMHAEGRKESLSYRDLGPRLAEYLKRMNFTHVELMPVMEHPFYGSWGYQCTGYFAPTSRFGTPQDFMSLVDHLHREGIGVILDWVPSHFPTDDWALGRFDGTHLYEHADPRLGIHPDWSSYIFNYGRNEVRSFLASSAMHWLDTYHVDGLRVDAVASMLYLDYSREPGEWIPNEHGGRENLEAIKFLQQLNENVYANHPDTHTIAEESTSWPGVSKPTYIGGLGFGMKWDMGWMHDTLQYFSKEPIHRRFHHNSLTFRMIYAFHENFVLPLSHDEVVHGKGSLIGKMPGDDWQRFANLRALYGYMWTQPAKKLLFMGGEIGQFKEWNHDEQLEWHLLDHPPHEGLRRLVEDLNRTYRDEPALHELDFDPAGFEWVDANDNEASVLSYLRKSRSGETILVVCNLTPVPRASYRVGVPHGGHWQEIMNTDAEIYGGSGVGNLGGVEAHPVPLHGRPRSLTIALPPLGVVLFRAEAPAGD